ncbi:hypothetical protein ATO6_04240 [Oceanicola sp. 22II-s10i]|uniref:MarR family winged helix-turn-helix transcriptional regulator n=1 Tax=Oceanicola sp. 22II-s10i TaxID=1317116 RepID=UPI000B5209BF|nr:MarR family transcriptional regulator [Oceanicola sp. 22II-s10i]OWU86078.1 hypothetical protein ATO6_04240 [Oceanicola sp. 22II-s10i]
MTEGPDILAMPGHLIRRLQQQATALFGEAMAETDMRLTPVQFAALSALAHAPGMDQATLAATISYDRATIGGVVDRLVARGVIARAVSQTDRRARVLSLTPEGQALLARARPLVETVQEQILAPLPEAERATFMAQLRRVAGAE